MVTFAMQAVLVYLLSPHKPNLPGSPVSQRMMMMQVGQVVWVHVVAHCSTAWQIVQPVDLILTGNHEINFLASTNYLAGWG
jgi:hypothetical protein